MLRILFSVPLEVQGRGQVEGSVVKRQTMHRGPEVQDIAMHRAVRLEALEDILAQMHGEGVRAIGGLAMQWAWPAPLLASAV